MSPFIIVSDGKRILRHYGIIQISIQIAIPGEVFFQVAVFVVIPGGPVVIRDLSFVV